MTDFDYDGYADGLLNTYMSEQADYERLCEWAKEWVDELDRYDVVDELEARGCDVVELLMQYTGFDAELFDNDAHKMLSALPSTNAYAVDRLREKLVEYKVDGGFPEPDEDARYDR